MNEISMSMNEPELSAGDEALTRQGARIAGYIKLGIDAVWEGQHAALFGEPKFNALQFVALWARGHLKVPIATMVKTEQGKVAIAGIAIVLESFSLLTDKRQYEVIFKATTPECDDQTMLKYIISYAEINNVDEVWDVEYHGGLEIRRKVYSKNKVGVGKAPYELLQAIKKM